MARKRSFFERLTGSVSLDEEAQLPPGFAAEQEVSAHREAAGEGEGELAVDVYQTANEIVIQAMVAGVKPEDLDVSITREMVTLRGTREPGDRVAGDDYFQRELYWGSFSRTILLPTEIDVEESEAIEKQGLLTIHLPKIDKERSQTLKVKST